MPVIIMYSKHYKIRSQSNFSSPPTTIQHDYDVGSIVIIVDHNNYNNKLKHSLVRASSSLSLSKQKHTSNNSSINNINNNNNFKLNTQANEHI